MYTIGYNDDINALKIISSINEAATINADSDDFIYQIGSLFNAEMYRDSRGRIHGGLRKYMTYRS